jgi:hypothetical protein
MLQNERLFGDATFTQMSLNIKGIEPGNEVDCESISIIQFVGKECGSVGPGINLLHAGKRAVCENPVSVFSELSHKALPRR